MKKYFTLAIALAAVAFISVSYLAQAEHAAEHKTMPAPAAPAVPAVEESAAAPAPAMADGDIKKDNDTCMMLAAAPSTEGAMPSDEMKDAEYKKCMMSKGHTEDAIKALAPAAPVMEAPKAEESKTEAQ